jgi:hypothetical protein
VIPLLRMLLPPAVLVLICMAAVELGEDRELFVSPPDAVAESFTRAVMTKRYPRARAYLLDPHSMSDTELRALQSRLGEGENVETDITSRDPERARVDVTMRGKTMELQLAWDEGWKVVPGDG